MSSPRHSSTSSRVNASGSPEEPEIDVVNDDSLTSEEMTAGTSSNLAISIARGNIEALRNRLTTEANQRRDDAMIIIRCSELEKDLINLPGATDLVQFLSESPRIHELLLEYCKSPAGINWDHKAEQYTVAIVTKLRGMLERLNPTRSSSKRKATAGFSGGNKHPRR